MMRALKILIRCVVGGVLGSCLGVALIADGRIQQGIGLAMMGGFLGVVLAVSGVFYKTNALETFWRGFLFFVRWTLAKNIPGSVGLVPLEDKEVPSRRPQRVADREIMDRRAGLGMKIGWALAIVPAILCAVYIRDVDPEPVPLWLEIPQRILIGAGIVFIVGTVAGMTVGCLTVPGVHRRDILLGTAGGVIVGVGLATAISSSAKVPAWHVYGFCCGMMGLFGTILGLMAGWSHRVAADEAHDEAGESRDDDIA